MLTVALVALGAQLVPARAAIVGATLIRTVHTSQFSPPSPDPAGITYNSAVGELMISDSEVDEVGIYQGKNLWQTTRTGTVTQTGVTTSYTREPTGLSFNPANRHLFVSDDNRKSIHEVDAGTDGNYGTADDSIVSKVQTDLFASTDPEDVTFAPEIGHLFIIDGKDTQVFDLTPGENGVFDGVAPGGDDSVVNFDVGAYGLIDPEGIVYNSERGTLFVVDHQTDAVYEFTIDGEFLNQINIAQARARKAAGITFAPATNEPDRMNMFIVDRGVDNNNNPDENDGKFYEMSIDLPPLDDEQTFLISLPVGQPADDAEEGPFGAVNTNSTDLELVQETLNKKPQTVILRFRGFPVPPDATILSSSIQFQSDSRGSAATNLTIAGESSVDSAPVIRAKFNLSSRPRTVTSVPWAPPAWAPAVAGPAQLTPDLSAVIQEVIDQDGWVAGNALSVIITGTGKRVAESVDGGIAPVLYVEYST